MGYVGQTIKITIVPNNMQTDSLLLFTGVIKEAQMLGRAGAFRGIIINGYMAIYTAFQWQNRDLQRLSLMMIRLG